MIHPEKNRRLGRILFLSLFATATLFGAVHHHHEGTTHHKCAVCVFNSGAAEPASDDSPVLYGSTLSAEIPIPVTLIYLPLSSITGYRPANAPPPIFS
jgi:hypothetical protein